MEKEIKANKIKSKDFLKLIAKSKPKYSYFAIGMLSGIVGAVLQLIVPQMIQPLISGFAQGIGSQAFRLPRHGRYDPLSVLL